MNRYRSIMLALCLCVFCGDLALAQDKPAEAPGAPGAAAAAPARSGPPTLAIFVKNHAGPALDDKIGAMEDSLISKMTEKGFSVISRENAANAVATFAKTGANVGDASKPGAAIDAVLSNNTSALRLGQSLGADYLLIATATTYGQSKKIFKGYGAETYIVTSKLRAGYTILDVIKGATLPGGGGTVEASVDTRLDKNSDDMPDVINDVLDDASTKLVTKMPDPTQAQLGVPLAAPTTGLTIRCNIQGQSLPDVVRNDKGEYIVTTTMCPVQATTASVELDGVIIGTATGTFKDVAKGLHKIRVSCKGSDDWTDYEGTIKVSEGMTLDIDLHLSDKGYAKWKDMTAIVQGIKAGTKLTDAQVEVMRGLAQKLRQSGYKVDIKQDVKVDTTQPTKIVNQADHMFLAQ